MLNFLLVILILMSLTILLMMINDSSNEHKCIKADKCRWAEICINEKEMMCYKDKQI